MTDYYALGDFHALQQARQCVKNLNFRKALHAKRELHPTAVAQITARFEKWPNEGLLLFAELRVYLKTRKQKPNIKFE